jgi:hypothetical protein
MREHYLPPSVREVPRRGGRSAMGFGDNVPKKRSQGRSPEEKAIAVPEAYGLTANKGYLKEANDSSNNTQKLRADAVAKGYLSLMKENKIR